MEYLILGLLMLSPMTGYDLQKFVKNNLSLICSSSAGSIQTAIKKLLKGNKITFKEEADGNRKKKIFLITEEGQKLFSSWVSQPMQAQKVKNMELSRLFFLGLAEKEKRISAIENYITQIKETKEVLRVLSQNFDTAKNSCNAEDSNLSDVLFFQGCTLEYGIAAAEFEEKWYTELLRKLEENK